MKRTAAAAVATGFAAVSLAALVLPLPFLAALWVASVGFLRSGRRGFVLFSVSNLVLNTALLALFLHGGATWRLGPLVLGEQGARVGLEGGLRLAAMVGANLAILSWASPARILEGLRPPRRATAYLAAILIAGHDVGRDFARLVAAQKLDGDWPDRLVPRIRSTAVLLPALLVSAVRRAEARREALQLAGLRMGPRFAPTVAVAALAVAGRLAFLALPNIKLTYVVVFLGGLLFGAGVGAAAGLVSMAFTDLLLTGLFLPSFANAPAMALVGGLGALTRRLCMTRGGTRADRASAIVFAAVAGAAGTMLFSVSSDALTWLMVPEYRTTPGTLPILVMAGLAFNVVPAIVNAALFAASIRPVTQAFRALGIGLVAHGSARGKPAAAGKEAPAPQ